MPPFSLEKVEWFFFSRFCLEGLMRKFDVWNSSRDGFVLWMHCSGQHFSRNTRFLILLLLHKIVRTHTSRFSDSLCNGLIILFILWLISSLSEWEVLLCIYLAIFFMVIHHPSLQTKNGFSNKLATSFVYWLISKTPLIKIATN